MNDEIRQQHPDSYSGLLYDKDTGEIDCYVLTSEKPENLEGVPSNMRFLEVEEGTISDHNKYLVRDGKLQRKEKVSLRLPDNAVRGKELRIPSGWKVEMNGVPQENRFKLSEAGTMELLLTGCDGRETRTHTIVVRSTNHDQREQLDAEVKQLRNRLLAESDWTQLPDNELTELKQLEWREYRQQLRKLRVTTESSLNELQVPKVPH